MPQIKLPEFTGGLNLNEASTIEDNELAKAQNVFYDAGDRLTTRRGITNFATPIPDAFEVIHNMDTFNGNGTWIGDDDAVNVATDADDKKEGSGSVSFDITVATSPNDYASLENTSLSAVDLSSVSQTGAFQMWVYIPDVTNFTGVRLFIGDDLTTNYYRLLVVNDSGGNPLANGWNHVSFDWAAMAVVGAPTDNMSAVSVRFNYAAGYTDQTDARVDNIVWVSGTSTVGATSLYHTRTIDGQRWTLAAAGEGIYLLDETTNSWTLIASGYTAGENFTFATYKDRIYFTNGVDDYSYFNPANFTTAGEIVTKDGSVPKGKYLIVLSDIGYLANAPGDRSIVFYSNANPPDLTSFPNSEPINIDDGNEITGLTNLGAIPIVAKENAIYSLNVLPTPVEIKKIDYSNGCTSHRTIQEVENDRYFLSDNGVFSLSQRQALEGSYRSDPLSRKIQPLIDASRNLDVANAFYWDKLNHYYINLDTTNNGIPDKCMVFNIKAKAWTEYTNIAARDMIEYEDANGEFHLIYADAFTGQIKEMETGFNDNGIEINVAIHTKEYDFDEPTLIKEYREIDINGFMSEAAEINETSEIDAEDVSSAIWNSDVATITSQFITLGTSPLGINPLTGSPIIGEGIPLYLFNVRIPVYIAGNRIQIKLDSSVEDAAWVLSKILIVSEETPFDFFPNDNIL